MTTPFYQDDKVTLFLGDCREITEWLQADVLVGDPPYGRNWRQGRLKARPGWHGESVANAGIAGDVTTEVRDAALALWGDRHAVVFGDLMLAPPINAILTAVYRKPPDAGMRGAKGGLRRDLEAIYLLGPWRDGMGGRSSLFTTSAATVGNPSGIAARSGHPHAKPLDVMEELIDACPPGVIADPFAGSGSTLVAARNLGRKAIGVEIDERHCETTAARLSQDCLDLGSVS